MPSAPMSGTQTVTIIAANADSNTASSDEDTRTFSVTVVAGASFAATPSLLTEANLDGDALTVTRSSGVTFPKAVSASSFALVTTPALAGL